MNQKVTTLANYPGNKSSSAAYPNILNHVPVHQIYYELFAGSAEIYKRLHPEGLATATLNDLNPITAELLRAEFPGTDVWNKNTIEYLENFPKGTFINSVCTFMYLDPPYVLSSRRSGGEIYSHEMSDDDHVQLLTAILQLHCNIMISNYDNEIYNELLADWYRVEFTVATRRGPATEVIWMNYNPDDYHLHTYQYIGKDRTDRQRIKRKQTRLLNKIKNLPKREQQMLLRSISKLWK